MYYTLLKNDPAWSEVLDLAKVADRVGDVAHGAEDEHLSLGIYHVDVMGKYH
jgi:hypothetical protein